MTESVEDLFTPIHKGLRAMMYDLSGRVQTNDFADLEASRALVADLETDFAAARSAGCMLCAFHHHADDEEAAVFPSVSPTNERLIASLIEDHHGLTRRELAITASGHELLRDPDPAGRVRAGVRLNLAVNELVAAYLSHMNREELELVPHMREHFTDAQMEAMRNRIIAGTPPDRLGVLMGWMLPALNATELTSLFVSVRRTAPPPVVAAAVRLCDTRVDPHRWTEVKSRLGM